MFLHFFLLQNCKLPIWWQNRVVLAQTVWAGIYWWLCQSYNLPIAKALTPQSSDTYLIGLDLSSQFVANIFFVKSIGIDNLYTIVIYTYLPTMHYKDWPRKRLTDNNNFGQSENALKVFLSIYWEIKEAFRKVFLPLVVPS